MARQHEGGTFRFPQSLVRRRRSVGNARVLSANLLYPQTLVPDETKMSARAGVDYYFIQDDGGMFKATIAYEPYFYIATRVSILRTLERTPLTGYRRAERL